MKKLLLAAVGLVALGVGAPASAADMPVKAAPPPPVAPIHNWTVSMSAVMRAMLGASDGNLTFDLGAGPLAGIFYPSHRTIDAKRLARGRADRLQLSGQLTCVRA